MSHGPYRPTQRGATTAESMLHVQRTEATIEPEQHAQTAKKHASQSPQKEKREITLTLGIFFDGTGNNSANTDNMLKACTARHYNLADSEAEGILGKCAKYHQAVKQMPILDTYPCIAPILQTSEISVETWYDDRMPTDRYSEPQKRSFAAMTLRDRIVKNDWSKVILRVMLDAAKDAGVSFEQQSNTDLPDDLIPLCEKAIAMGKAVRSGSTPSEFSKNELYAIAKNYIHCSANWNSIVADSDGFIRGGASPSEAIGFVNRPDEKWSRTIYNMDGKKLEG